MVSYKALNTITGFTGRTVVGAYFIRLLEKE